VIGRPVGYADDDNDDSDEENKPNE